MTPLKPYKMPFRTRLKIRLGMFRVWLQRTLVVPKVKIMVPVAALASVVLVVGYVHFGNQAPATQTVAIDTKAVYERHKRIVQYFQVAELKQYATQIERKEINQTRLREKLTLGSGRKRVLEVV